MTQNSFTIIEKLSEGPTAIVFKAKQDALDRIVLLKKLQAYLVQDDAAASRFMREAKACALLKSENIVQVYDVTEFEQSPAIVMEFVDGTPLDELLNAHGPFDEQFLRRTAIEVLTALENAHANGVIHRDIKPSNIILSDRDVTKVTDFGIAAVASAPALTMDGNLMGTPAYMSPEQARGEAVDERTDFFSLGVTLLELASGEKIFGGSSYAECLGKILNFRGELPEALMLHFSADFKSFLAKLIAPEKAQRYTTATEALKEISHTTTAHAHEKPVRSYRATVALTSLTVIVMAALTIFFSSHRKENNSFSPVSPTLKETTAVSEPSELKNSLREDAVPPSTSLDHFPQQLVIRKSPVEHSMSAENAASKNDASPDSGYLAITCIPGGKVFIDNQFIETTPVAGTVKVKAGNHTVTFVNPYFDPVMKTITIQKDAQTDVKVNFLDNAGYLFVSADPWADVYIDGQHRDTTPLSKPIILSAGVKKIRLYNPAFKDYETTVTIISHDTVRVTYSFDVAKK
ncbi:MAG: serine/threonine protein kinase [Bacteroidota bacterium]|nr:serine/threonine protein kinase [Bacteroidota bacterium]